MNLVLFFISQYLFERLVLMKKKNYFALKDQICDQKPADYNDGSNSG